MIQDTYNNNVPFDFRFRELLFSSRAEEIAVLRKFSDALVRNLFPESLRGQEVNRCVLNEIIALQGKKVFNCLSAGIHSNKRA